MPAEVLVIAVLPALLALAAGWDLATYTIPNRIQILLLIAFAMFVATTGIAKVHPGEHGLAGAIGLAAGFTLFSFGYIGGGDAKLFACVALWLGLHDLLIYIVVASAIGGGLTLVLLSLRQLPLPAALVGQSWILRLHDRQAGIPYGVALAAGALAILPQTEILHLVARV